MKSACKKIEYGIVSNCIVDCGSIKNNVTQNYILPQCKFT